MTKTEVKTIMEFLAENPQVDVSAAWKRLWGIQTRIVDRLRARFPSELHPRLRKAGDYISPAEERAAQCDFDFKVRELGYRLDPMNVLPQKVFGEEEFQRMLELRIGTEQIREALARS